MLKIIDKVMTVLGFIIIGPIASLICLMDIGSSKKTFKENFKEVFALAKWSRTNFTSDKKDKK